MTTPSCDSLWKKIRGGVVPAMATPLREDGYTIDLDGVGRVVDFLIERGAVGLFVGGTTGEGILLPVVDRKALHAECVRAARRRVPILAHAGDNTTAGAIALARHGADIGVDAVVAVTPTFYALPDTAMVKHYAAIGSATDVPLFPYDIPQMAVNAISPAALRQLAKAVPTFAGLKSSRTDTNALRDLIQCLAPAQGLLAGFEPTALASLAMGAQGLVSGLATAVPEPVVALAQAVGNGDLGRARQHQATINQVLDLFPANNRIGYLKAILAARGVNVGPPVPPRPPGDGGVWTNIAAVLGGREGSATLRVASPKP